MILISNLILSILDGSTISSTEIYGVDKKTYVDIGSGNVFKLTWKTELETNPVFTNDTVDHYKLVIKRFDPTLNVYYDIFDRNIGLINEFYINSEMLPSVPLQYILSIYVVAYGKQGSAITSNIVNPYVCKGSGAYVKVQPEGYAQPIMKRALAFAKTTQAAMAAPVGVVALAHNDGFILQDINEKILVTSDLFLSKIESDLADKNGVPLIAKADNDSEEPLSAVTAKLLTNVNGWDLMQESYTKDGNKWRTSDISFEMLIAGDENDSSYGDPIEVIVGYDANREPIYEPLYVL